MSELTTPATSKRCSKCREDKPYSEYRRNKSRPDGYAHYCKPCAGLARKLWAEKHPEAARQLKRKNYRENHAVELERARLQRVKNPGRSAEYHRKRDLKHPEKRKAVNAVNQAVSRGDLPHVTTQECRSCGKPAANYHHHSYAACDWLNVIPLCRSCHRLVHTGTLEWQEVKKDDAAT